jgi:signal transduction histidine kinase
VDQQSRALRTVACSVLERLDVEVVLGRVLESARELTGARYAALGVLDESRTELARFLALGIEEPARRAIGALPRGRGVLGELIRDPRPLRLIDVGSHPYSYGFPLGHPPMSTFLGVPILIDGRPFGNLYLTEKEGGSEFTAEDEQSVVLLAEFAAIAIDHARRYAASEAQRIDLEHSVSALDATIQIARALGGQTNLEAILELVAKRGRALVSARALVIELLRSDELELAAGAGELPRDLIGRRVLSENTVASAALRSGESQRLTDRLNRARFDQNGLGHLGMTAENGLVVPLIFRDQRFGVLVALDNLQAGDFTLEHQRLLEAFASSAAVAVATAESAANDRRRQRLAAAEAERARWARELHDETLQALGSLRLVLSAAGRSGDPSEMSSAIATAVSQLELDITSLRGLITELRPAALDELGIEPALLSLIDRFRSRGLKVDAQVDLGVEQGDGPRLEPELETGIYRIVQEALTNAVKHGGARRAVVEVIEEHERIRITIRDDGSGFEPSDQTGGFGLTGMRERVALLGGGIDVESEPGGGAEITASFPATRVGGVQRGAAPLRLA